jgi:hypothetical protein
VRFQREKLRAPFSEVKAPIFLLVPAVISPSAKPYFRPDSNSFTLAKRETAMIDIITGFAVAYGVPMFLLRRYILRSRAGALRPTTGDRTA